MICSVILLSIVGLAVAPPPPGAPANYYDLPESQWTIPETREVGELGLPAGSSKVVANIKTDFSCQNREYGYYADVPNNCQIYHICHPSTNAKGEPVIFHFANICPANTQFDQKKLACLPINHLDLLTCSESSRFYPATESRFKEVFVPTHEAPVRTFNQQLPCSENFHSTNLPCVQTTFAQRTPVVERVNTENFENQHPLPSRHHQTETFNEQLPNESSHLPTKTNFHGKTSVRRETFPTKGGNNFPVKGNFGTKNLPKPLPITQQRELPIEQAPIKGNTNFPTKSFPTKSFPTKSFPTKNTHQAPIKSPLRTVVRPAAYPEENYAFTTFAPSKTNFVPQKPITQERIVVEEPFVQQKELPIEQAPVKGHTNFPTKNFPTKNFPTKNVVQQRHFEVQAPLISHNQEVRIVRPAAYPERYNDFTTTFAPTFASKTNFVPQKHITQERIEAPIVQEKHVEFEQQRVEAPITQEKIIEQPIVQQKELPIVQQKELPIVQQKELPIVQQKELPIVQQKELPIVQQKELPMTQQKEVATPFSQERTPFAQHQTHFTETTSEDVDFRA